MTPRDDLAALIRKAGWDAQDSPDYEKCGFDSDLFTADAILARWRLVPVEESPAYTDYKQARGAAHWANEHQHRAADASALNNMATYEEPPEPPPPPFRSFIPLPEPTDITEVRIRPHWDRKDGSRVYDPPKKVIPTHLIHARSDDDRAADELTRHDQDAGHYDGPRLPPFDPNNPATTRRRTG